MSESYRFHLVSLPWTQTLTDEFSWCAYTSRVIRFAKMMTARGHEVIVYSGPDNDAVCTEHVEVITADEQAPILGTQDAPWNSDHPAWVAMNHRAIVEINKRAKPADFLLLVCGPAQQVIANSLPQLTAVEYGIGYHATSAQFRVFESAAWMHTLYGKQQGTDWDGRNGDVVIPNYYDPDDFHVAEPGDYFLFIGRGIARKGVGIAAAVCEYLDQRLIIAGADLGGMPAYGEKVGIVGPERRSELMAGAIATFVPTLYGGPFEGVAVEAMMSGCPVITSDWGVFQETIGPEDGWRCRTTPEYVDAARAALAEATYAEPGCAHTCEIRELRRQRAVDRFSLEAVGPQYERFFGRLMELWDPKGWLAFEHASPAVLRALAAGEAPSQ